MTSGVCTFCRLTNVDSGGEPKVKRFFYLAAVIIDFIVVMVIVMVMVKGLLVVL